MLRKGLCDRFCPAVCDQKNIEKDFLIVYTYSKHIEKLEISRRRKSAYIGVDNAVCLSTISLLSYYLFRIVHHFSVSHALHNNYL